MKGSFFSAFCSIFFSIVVSIVFVCLLVFYGFFCCFPVLFCWMFFLTGFLYKMRWVRSGRDLWARDCPECSSFWPWGFFNQSHHGTSTPGHILLHPRCQWHAQTMGVGHPPGISDEKKQMLRAVKNSSWLKNFHRKFQESWKTSAMNCGSDLLYKSTLPFAASDFGLKNTIPILGTWCMLTIRLNWSWVIHPELALLIQFHDISCIKRYSLVYSITYSHFFHLLSI